MIKIAADKEIPYLDDFFSNEDIFNLKKLDWEEIHNKALRDMDILISRSVTTINKELLENTNIKMVGSITAGEDHINFKDIKNLPIIVKTAKGANAKSVVEYTLSALGLCPERKKEIFIIGQGFVGTKLKEILEYFDYQITTYDPYVNMKDNKYANWELAYKDKTRKKELFNVSINASYSKEGKYPSHQMINCETKIGSSALLINTSRGEVIDYTKLHFRQCVNDVWNNEPNPKVTDFKINGPNQIYSSPHIAGNTFEAKYESLSFIFNDLKRFFSNDFPELENISRPAFKNLEQLNITNYISELNESLNGNNIPFEFLKQFVDVEEIDKRFREEIPLKNSFQKFRNLSIRKGFGEYELYAENMSSDLKEMLIVLGFRIQEE